MARRLAWTVIIVSVIVLFLAIGFRAVERETFLKAQSEALKSNTAVRISASCGAAVWQFDEQALDIILKSELLDPTLVSIRIFQNDTDTIEWLTRLPSGAISRVAKAPEGQFDTRNFPIQYGRDAKTVTTLATVSLWFDDAPLMNDLLSDILWNVIIVTFVAASLTVTLSWNVLRRLVRPLETIRFGMLEAAGATSKGAETPSIVKRLPGTAFPELDRMARDLDAIFEKIAHSISRQKASEAKIQNLNDNLENLVAERTAELAKTNAELNLALESLKKVQDELVNSAQLAVLGRLVASIAHEINTPLGAIVSSNSTISAGLATVGPDVLSVYADLKPEGKQLFLTLLAAAADRSFPNDLPDDRQLRKRYFQFLESQGDSDSHNLADLLVETGFRAEKTELERLVAVPEYASVIRSAGKLSSLLFASRVVGVASEKVTKFVSALKTYSRSDSLDESVEVDIPKSLETVLLLFQHEIKLGITVVRDFHPVPAARCRPDSIQQVWTNLISNAFHAMGHKGQLTVGVYSEPQWIVVTVEDTGTGISPDVQSRIFTPFFTTKKPGEGTGLGLDIARRIVTDCGGTIQFQSVPGKTVFQVKLPIADFLP